MPGLPDDSQAAGQAESGQEPARTRAQGRFGLKAPGEQKRLPGAKPVGAPSVHDHIQKNCAKKPRRRLVEDLVPPLLPERWTNSMTLSEVALH